MKVISVKKEQLLIVFYVLVITAGVVTAFRNEAVATFAMPVSKKIIIIDAGHGGWDPGKVASDVQEKDINLQISKKLQAYLEQGGSYVIMTRVDDEALGTQKRADLNDRKRIANSSKADMIVSIHQNSFPSGNVSGSQVFYYEESDKSKKLAECIQHELSSFLGQNKKRDAKSNSSYYILKQTTMPAVIVECGFLTNYGERQKLTQDEYQDKVAWGIYKGIIAYYEEDGA